jgi:hypothetical protein
VYRAIAQRIAEPCPATWSFHLARQALDRFDKVVEGRFFFARLPHGKNAVHLVKYWRARQRRKITADNLSKAGWSWGCVSAIDSNGRTIWIADAHRDDGKRFVVHADEKLTAFLELESAIRACCELA